MTFSNVTDWSTDEVDLGPEPIDLEMGEDDDGKRINSTHYYLHVNMFQY